MLMKVAMRVRRAGSLLLASVVLLAGCRSTGRLAEYQFPGSTVAVSFGRAPRPEVLTGPYFLDPPRSAVEAIIRAGTTIAKEIEASEARDKLDAAADQVDVVARLADRTLERAALHLRSRPVENTDDADFIFDVMLREYGIDAEDWNAAAHFYVEAEVFLIDGRDGTQIWKSKIKSRDRIMPAIFGPGTVVRDVVTAAVLANLSVEEISRALERLADYSADRITGRLRDALEEVQRKNQQRVTSSSNR